MAIGSKVRVSVLCPSWVKTGIFEADRNRPAADSNPETEEGAKRQENYKQLGALLLTGAMSASEVASRPSSTSGSTFSPTRTPRPPSSSD